MVETIFHLESLNQMLVIFKTLIQSIQILVIAVLWCHPAAAAREEFEKIVSLVNAGSLSQLKPTLDLFTSQELSRLLFDAVTEKNPQILKILLENGVSSQFKFEDGQTLLHRALDLGTAEILMAHGADVNEKDLNGRTPLFAQILIFGRNYGSIARIPTPELADLFILHGADLKHEAYDGKTPLTHVIEKLYNNTDTKEYIELAKVLIRHSEPGVINEKDARGRTPLFSISNPELAQFAIDSGAQVNVQDFEGNTPLHIVRSGPVADILLQMKADVTIYNEKGLSPIDLALTNNKAFVVHQLGKHQKMSSEQVSEYNKKSLIKEIYKAEKTWFGWKLSLDCEGSEYPRWRLDNRLLHDLIAEGHFEKFNEIKLVNCEFSELPSNFSALTKLKTLTIQGTNLHSFHPLISLKDSIENLDLSKNKIDQIPQSVLSLKKLRVLRLSNNQIQLISPEILKMSREQIHSFEIKGNPVARLFQDSASLFINTKKTQEMVTLLDPNTTLSGQTLEEAVCDPEADLLFYIKTPGKEVESLLKGLIENSSGALFTENNLNGKLYRPASQLLAQKLLVKHRMKQNLKLMESPTTEIGNALDGKSLIEKSRENIKKMDELLGTMSPDEEQIYHQIIHTHFYIKHYTDLKKYQQMKDTDFELKSLRSLLIAKAGEVSHNSQDVDFTFGNTGNVFFRLEMSPDHISQSRFGKSVIVMDEQLLYNNGIAYLWDLVDSVQGIPSRGNFKYDEKLLRTAERSRKSHEKGHLITIRYPKMDGSKEEFKFNIMDSFFYGADIKHGLAKFMVYEIRKMGMTENVLKKPELLEKIYIELYSVQGLLPNEVKLNPTNHRFFIKSSQP